MPSNDRLVGIPVRLREETVLDRNRYMQLVESTRAFVAASEDGRIKAPLRGDLEYGWALVCEQFEELGPKTARMVRSSTEGMETFAYLVVDDNVAVRVYMALTGASREDVVKGLLAYVSGDVDEPSPAAPIGEPTP